MVGEVVLQEEVAVELGPGPEVAELVPEQVLLEEVREGVRVEEQVVGPEDLEEEELEGLEYHQTSQARGEYKISGV